MVNARGKSPDTQMRHVRGFGRLNSEKASFFVCKSTHLPGDRLLMPIGIHAGQEMDPGEVDKVSDLLHSSVVTRAQVISVVYQQLAAQDLLG